MPSQRARPSRGHAFPVKPMHVGITSARLSCISGHWPWGVACQVSETYPLMSKMEGAMKGMLAGGLLALAGCATTTAQPPLTLSSGARYVSLGSSYAAGAGIGTLLPGTPQRCGRTQNNYARLLAADSGLGAARRVPEKGLRPRLQRRRPGGRQAAARAPRLPYRACVRRR